MNIFYNRNIFSRKKFNKETQVDFNQIEICLLKKKIKQLESLNASLNSSLQIENKLELQFEFGVDEENKRFVKNKDTYILYY